MTVRAVILGASGYAGGELLRLLHRHPLIDAVRACANTNAGQRIVDIFPSLATAYRDHTFHAVHVPDLRGLDIAFVALPHGVSQELMPELIETVPHVVDLGADFRLPSDTYQRWYHGQHVAPQLLDRFVYGLPELNRRQITATNCVATPGCFPTAAVLALAPLVKRGLVARDAITVVATSGVSGRGRGLSELSLFCEVDENVLPYSPFVHRHTAEIEHTLEGIGSAPVRVAFVPQLAPLSRGILATCLVRPSAWSPSTAALVELYEEDYGSEPFVHVSTTLPQTKGTITSNLLWVSPVFDARTGLISVFAALDNLVKGAAGQAIQCANVMLGLAETSGLDHVPVFP